MFALVKMAAEKKGISLGGPDFDKLYRLVQMGDQQAAQELELQERRRGVKGVLPVGKTLDMKGDLRVHRYRPSIKVTDLTNAGKRGKKVSMFSVYDIDRIRSAAVENALEEWAAALYIIGYEGAYKGALELIEFAKNLGSHVPKIETREEKGVRVTPASQPPIEVRGSFIEGEVEADDFRLTDSTDPYNMMTIIPSRAKKTSTKKFYAWAREHPRELHQMTLREVAAKMSELKVYFRQFAMMD
jgi:hypothetical protein